MHFRNGLPLLVSFATFFLGIISIKILIFILFYYKVISHFIKSYSNKIEHIKHFKLIFGLMFILYIFRSGFIYWLLLVLINFKLIKIFINTKLFLPIM